MKFEDHLINANQPVLDALRQLNSLGRNLLLFVCNDAGALVGVLTDGDIRRGMIQGGRVEDAVGAFCNSNFVSIREGDVITPEMFQSFKIKNIKAVPVLDDKNIITRVISLDEYHSLLPLTAVIMAGGEGRRLLPLTKEIPKPMLQVGAKPILEHNIDRLIRYGIKDIYVSVNYLGEIISDYFKDGSDKGINIHYIHEPYPMGTIGALRFIKDDLGTDKVLLMNSDLLTDINFERFYLNHIDSQVAMSVASIPYVIDVPYAVMESEDGFIKNLLEKPKYEYFANAGIYLLNRDLLDLIPEGKFYDAPDLIQQLMQAHKPIANFPIHGYWLDIGRHEDYQRALKDIKIINFL